MDAAGALRDAVEVARLAPSVHDTQPWRWRLREPTVLELHTERSRRPAVADPDALLLMASCGAALHHARLSLAAAGLETDIERLPAPDLLARISVTGLGEPDQRAAQLVEAARHRRTDRRPVADRSLPASVLASVAAAVAAEDVGFYLLHPDEVVELTVAVDGAARYALLHGGDDTPQCRLRAGEALSGAWLTALLQGLSVLPISGPVEVVATRESLRRLLSDLGYPYLALRLGYPHP